MARAWWAVLLSGLFTSGCGGGSGSSSSSGTGGGMGTSTSGSSTTGSTGTMGTSTSGSSTTGSTGTMCTNDYTGAGVSQYTEVAGSCIDNGALCGEITCTEYVGPDYVSAYQANPTHWIATTCGAADEIWLSNVTCPQVVADLGGGCEISGPGGEGATQQWATVSPYDCYSCPEECAPPGVCLVPPLPPVGDNCPDILPTATATATATATGATTGGGDGAGSSGSSGSTGSTGSGGAPTCVGSLSGGPVSGTPTFACTATEMASGVGLTLSLNADTSVPGDGGWSGTQAFLVTYGSMQIEPGTFAGTDGGTWGATFEPPTGAGVQSNGVGSIVFDVTAVDLTGGSNATISGTATVVVPGWTNGHGDGGYITAQYEFSD